MSSRRFTLATVETVLRASRPDHFPTSTSPVNHVLTALPRHFADAIDAVADIEDIEDAPDESIAENTDVESEAAVAAGSFEAERCRPMKKRSRPARSSPDLGPGMGAGVGPGMGRNGRVQRCREPRGFPSPETLIAEDNASDDIERSL